MAKVTSMICAVAMAFPMISVSPAISAPVYLSVPAVSHEAATPVIDVQYRRHRSRYHRSHKRYRHRHHHNRRYRGGDVAAGIIGGLAAGAIIGGIANSQAHSVPPRNYHVEWCLGKYRSYDIRTNTYQPFNGPRRFCHSPYR